LLARVDTILLARVDTILLARVDTIAPEKATREEPALFRDESPRETGANIEHPDLSRRPPKAPPTAASVPGAGEREGERPALLGYIPVTLSLSVCRSGSDTLLGTAVAK